MPTNNAFARIQLFWVWLAFRGRLHRFFLQVASSRKRLRQCRSWFEIKSTYKERNPQHDYQSLNLNALSYLFAAAKRAFASRCDF